MPKDYFLEICLTEKRERELVARDVYRRDNGEITRFATEKQAEASKEIIEGTIKGAWEKAFWVPHLIIENQWSRVWMKAINRKTGEAIFELFLGTPDHEMAFKQSVKEAKRRNAMEWVFSLLVRSREFGPEEEKTEEGLTEGN